MSTLTNFTSEKTISGSNGVFKEGWDLGLFPPEMFFFFLQTETRRRHCVLSIDSPELVSRQQRCVHWTWTWMTSSVTRSQSNTATLGCGETGEDRGGAENKSAPQGGI